MTGIKERMVALVATMLTVGVSLKEFLTGYGEWMIQFSDWFGSELAEMYVGEPLEAAGAGERTVRVAQGLADNILTFVVVGIVILLGILIYSEIDTSIPDPTNTDLSNASSNATTTFSDAMELAPLVVLVGVAGLILVVVQRFR